MPRPDKPRTDKVECVVESGGHVRVLARIDFHRGRVRMYALPGMTEPERMRVAEFFRAHLWSDVSHETVYQRLFGPA